MGDRARFLIGVLASLALHGVLFATVPSWAAEGEDEVGTAPASPAIEVVTLTPEMVREILEPRVRPAMASLQEASSEHALVEAPAWPTLHVERPADVAPERLRDLVPLSLDTPTVTNPPIVDLLRPVSPVPAVDVTPPPPPPVPEVAEAATEARDTGPPALEGLAGLVTHREPLTYPAQAERRGLEGVAVLAVEVGIDGRVKTTRILRSSGHRELDRAAQRNLSRWRFDPAAVTAAGRGWVFRQDVVFRIQ